MSSETRENIKNDLTELCLKYDIKNVDMVHAVKIEDSLLTDGEFMDIIRECIAELDA